MLRIRKKQSHVDSIEAYACICQTTSCPACACNCPTGTLASDMLSQNNHNISVVDMNNRLAGG